MNTFQLVFSVTTGDQAETFDFFLIENHAFLLTEMLYYLAVMNLFVKILKIILQLFPNSPWSPIPSVSALSFGTHAWKCNTAMTILTGVIHTNIICVTVWFKILFWINVLY